LGIKKKAAGGIGGLNSLPVSRALKEEGERDGNEENKTWVNCERKGY